MSCAGADGTCERPAKKGGFCWGHWKRRQPLRAGARPTAETLQQRAETPLEALFLFALELRDELDTATDEDFQRRRERFRFGLRQYLWKYVPKLLRRHRAQLEQPGGVEAFLTGFGDKASHSYPRHSKTPPTKFRRRPPPQDARSVVRREVRLAEIEEEDLHRGDHNGGYPLDELKLPKQSRSPQSNPQHAARKATR